MKFSRGFIVEKVEIIIEKRILLAGFFFHVMREE